MITRSSIKCMKGHFGAIGMKPIFGRFAIDASLHLQGDTEARVSVRRTPVLIF
jgi:hypothetical protein